MIELLIIGIVFGFVGLLVARLPIMESLTDYLADKLFVYIDSKTTADNDRVSVGQGTKYDRAEEELITR